MYRHQYLSSLYAKLLPKKKIPTWNTHKIELKKITRLIDVKLQLNWIMSINLYFIRITFLNYTGCFISWLILIPMTQPITCKYRYVKEHSTCTRGVSFLIFSFVFVWELRFPIFSSLSNCIIFNICQIYS